MRRRSGRRYPAPFAVVALLTASTALTLMASSAGASAQTPVQIEIGTPPGGVDNIAIECTWVLMDMDDDPASGFEYRIDGATDDDESRRNDGSLQPCDFHTDALDSPTYETALIDAGRLPSRGVIQANANNGDGHVGDLMGAQRFEIWTAVDVFDANTAARDVEVSHDVFHPDGSVKFQLYASQVPCATADDMAPLGYDVDTQTILAGDYMFNAASYAGGAGTLQISVPAVVAQGSTNKGIAKQCLQGVKELYRSGFTLSKHQPHGLYRVRTVATDRSDTEILDNVTFYVQRSINLRADFTAVSFPPTSPGGVSIVSGDVAWVPAGGSPTLYNDGLSGLNLTVSFSRMCGGHPADGVDPGVCPETNPLAKEITDFDVSFGLDSGHLSHFRPQDGNGVKATGETPGGDYPNAEADFGHGDYQTLCANETGKIDFSAHLDSAQGLRSGMVLAGSVTLMARLDGGSSGEDEGGPWGSNFATANAEDPTIKTCNNDNWIWGGFTGVDYDNSAADLDLDGNGSSDEGLYGQPNGNDQTNAGWPIGLPTYDSANYGNQRSGPGIP